MAADSVNDLIHRIRVLASTHGYAIVVHGSLERDVDLIAVPWIRHTSTADELAASVARALGSTVRQRCERVHGRVGYVVNIPGGGLPSYIDLSVISPQTPRGQDD